MSIIKQDDLKNEKKEEFDWEINPIKRSIQSMFKNHFNEGSYRKISISDARAIVEEKFSQEGLLKESSKYFTVASRLLRRVNSKNKIEDLILVLGDYLID